MYNTTEKSTFSLRITEDNCIGTHHRATITYMGRKKEKKKKRNLVEVVIVMVSPLPTIRFLKNLSLEICSGQWNTLPYTQYKVNFSRFGWTTIFLFLYMEKNVYTFSYLQHYIIFYWTEMKTEIGS